MDYNHNDQWDRWNSSSENSSYYNQPTHRPYDQGFSIASLIFGILSITLGCCGFSVFTGAFGIFFALMCYRKGKKLNSSCMTGLVLSIIGIVIGVLSIALAFYMIFHNPAYMEQFNQSFRQVYGMSFEEMLQNYYGITF